MAGPAREPQRLSLHIGLPKSGTSYLQSVLAENRDALRKAGAVYPFVRPEAMFHAAVELRQQHELWGLPPELVDGTWQLLLDRVRSVGGTGVISHEILAGASEDVVARVLADTADLEVHLVVTVRDLARQATAHWQEEVKNGRAWSFAEFEQALFEEGESDTHELGFWRSQDLLSVLGRWAKDLPPDRVHVVVAPPAGAPADELWRRFARAAGLPPDCVDLSRPAQRNVSLGTPQVALLRRVVAAVDGRLDRRDHALVVKRLFAQTELAALPGPRPVAPAGLTGRLAGVAEAWAPALESRGLRVYGDLGDVVPAQPPTGARHPDDVTEAEMMAGLPDVVADLLVEIAGLRRATTAGMRESGEGAAGGADASPTRPGLLRRIGLTRG